MKTSQLQIAPSRWMTATIAVFSVLVFGCDDSKDTDPDTTVEECEPFDEWETADDGADVSSPPPAGEARAGRIASAGDVPVGVKSQSEVGDYMLRNDKVMFVIEDIGESDGYQPFGGGIVHADLVGPDGEAMERNNFGESFHGLSIRLLDPTSITVMSDGSDGGEAVVRIVGPMRNMPLLDVAFGFFFEVADGAEYIADWVLGPDAEFLELRYHIRNPLPQWAYINLFIFGAIQGDGLAIFTPEDGFDLDGLSGAHALFGHVGEEISYAWINPDDATLQYVMEESQILVGEKGLTLPMEGCTETTIPAIRLLVADGGAENLMAAARRVAGLDEPSATTFDVSVAGDADATATRIHVTDTEGAYVTSVIGDADGEFTAGLEPGDYLLTAVLEGHPVVRDEPFSVTASGADVAVEISEPGTLSYTVVDEEGTSLPAKIMVFEAVTSEQLPSSFGEKRYPLSALVYVYDPLGGDDLLLPPGDYTITTSRGFEYEMDEIDVTVTAGETTTADLVLEHVVDSTGMLCGDFHIHSTYSPDSSDPRLEKVEAGAAEGVEIMVSTDHEWVADYQVDIEAAGLESWVHGVPGEELTTYDYGHMNIYPQTIREDRPNNGAINWYYRSAEDVFTEVHTDPMDPVLQINHPRSGGSLGGYFAAVGFDPETGTVSQPDVWSPLFESIEVFNCEDFRSQESETVADWFTMLNMGMRATAMGNSDSHSYVGTEIGYPRSCLVVGHDDPLTLTNIDIRDTVKAMEVFINGGILVTAQALTGEGPGEIADAPSGTLEIHVTVQAPLWMEADRLRIFVDGVQVETITLDATTADSTNPVIRYDDDIVVVTDDGADGWVVVVAEGDSAMTPVAEGRMPFGVTNPIYMDADGDSEYTPRMSMP